MAVTRPASGWTYQDLVALPDDGKHYEIIGGELYEMPPPGWDHVRVIMNLIRLLLPVADRIVPRRPPGREECCGGAAWR